MLIENILSRKFIRNILYFTILQQKDKDYKIITKLVK